MINEVLTVTNVLVSFTISATDGEAVLEEDSITLTFTSAHEDFVNQVEKLGEFVSYKAVVIITDNDSKLTYYVIGTINIYKLT